MISKKRLDFRVRIADKYGVYDTRSTKGVRCMTKGNPKLIVRVPGQLIDEMRLAIAQRNRRTRDEPWVMSDFVRVAIRDKLAHIKRSRCKRRAGRAGHDATAAQEG
jgi:hypothetical protein